MRSRRSRNITVFSLSVLDLLSSSLGAFILVVFILFPYYGKGGDTDEPAGPTMKQLEEEADKRQEAAASVAKESSKILTLEQQIELLDKEYATEAERLSRIQDETNKAIMQIASIEVPDVKTPKPEEKPVPPRGVASGVAFSILGLATQKKKIVVLVDMSGSMEAYTSIAERALLEILGTMKPDFQFAIMGYHDANILELYPSSGGMIGASPSSIQQAIQFTRSLSSKFAGGTPTNYALQYALVRYPGAESIVLMSDGEPTDGTPADIMRGVDQVNGRKRVEINTVAVGDYTKEPKLALFLQELAERNDGEFVGLSH